jgi:ABC-type proline/glycine betaine transport system ATPase subunit
MKLPKAERRARTERMVASLGVKIDLNRYPYELSGGQQQLVSIMRALVVEPQILFLDEPFSALDYEMTLFMRDQLQRIFVETGTTTVLVSHDLEEAVYLADRILLLSRRPACIADYVHYDAARPRTARKTRLLAAKVMGASRIRVLTDVMLLESLPQTFVGLRNGVSLALVIVVVAEMFIGSTDGLGQRVFEAQQLFAMPDMYAAIFAAGGLGYGLNLMFLLVERQFVHWSGK